jgi:hypothetical protein
MRSQACAAASLHASRAAVNPLTLSVLPQPKRTRTAPDAVLPQRLATEDDMDQPLDAAATHAAHAVGALPELLALVFERLPPVEQCVTVSRLARSWRRWAAPKREPLRAAWFTLPIEQRHLPQWEDQCQLPQWCLAEAWPRLTEPQRASAAQRAAASGDLDRLQWLRSQDPPCPWDYQTCAEAAVYGHLDVLQWLRAQEPPCPWDAGACTAAACSGHLDVLQWLRAQDPPCPWSHYTCTKAARGGQLDVLRFLRAQQPPCPWDVMTCCEAAVSGRLDVMRWLRAQQPPCPWSDFTCTMAAANGRLHLLQWVRAQDPPCPWNAGACYAAAMRGHLHVLQWLRSQAPPCPWDKAACRAYAHDPAMRAWVDTQPDNA